MHVSMIFFVYIWSELILLTAGLFGNYARVGDRNRYDEDIPLDLIFFSPFEDLRLRTAGIMESKGIHRVY
jgi:hypothetical protein